MAKYEIANAEGIFHVYDDTGEFLGAFTTRQNAKDFVKELKDDDAKAEQAKAEHQVSEQPEVIAEAEPEVVTLGEIELTTEPAKAEIEPPKAKPVTATVAYVQTGKPASKADRIREQIGLAKANGLNGDVVVTWANVELGMAKPLAKKYVKENWMKVPG